MTKQKNQRKKYKDPVFVTVVIIVAVIALAAIGFSIRYIRAHHSPNDIKSFVLSRYNGSQAEDSQVSQTLTITPNSCNLVIQTPSQDNYATTIECPINSQIWNTITNAYFTNSLPTNTAGQIGTPATGQLLLLGVYYKDGTSNTIYFSEPVEANVESFVQMLKSYAPANSGL